MKDSQLPELGRICAKAFSSNLELRGFWWQGGGDLAMDVNEAGCWLGPTVAPLNSRNDCLSCGIVVKWKKEVSNMSNADDLRSGIPSRCCNNEESGGLDTIRSIQDQPSKR
ncbi:hypothetical protein TNCV_3691011 [Trichonephila clavipes]|nr:hypothetical protein TNCV_3691011 [Trichonephila clavipes]